MDETGLSSSKLQKCITNSWNFVNKDFNKYLNNINLGERYVKDIIAHKTTAKSIESVNIEDTQLFRMFSDIHKRLQHAIEREILSEETHLQDILYNLHNNFESIIVEIDKIFNVYKSQDFSLSEMVKASETSLSFAEMLEALDRFKRFFTHDHNERRYTLDILHFTDDPEKVSDFWQVSELVVLKQDLDLILAMES